MDDYSPHNPIEDAEDFFAFMVYALAQDISPAATENNIQTITDELTDLFPAIPLVLPHVIPPKSSDHFGM